MRAASRSSYSNILSNHPCMHFIRNQKYVKLYTLKLKYTSGRKFTKMLKFNTKIPKFLFEEGGTIFASLGNQMMLILI